MSETTSGEDRHGAGLVAQGRHPVNVGQLVMGTAFLGLVAVWALVQGGVVGTSGARWLLPLPWVFAGVAGLVAAAVTARRHATTRTGWVAAEDADRDQDADRAGSRDG